MPYITQEQRGFIDDALSTLINTLDWVESDKLDGVMNYVITKIIRSQYNNGKYAEYNSAIGVLECCKLEFYARAVRPYEDTKIQVNGDV